MSRLHIVCFRTHTHTHDITSTCHSQEHLHETQSCENASVQRDRSRANDAWISAMPYRYNDSNLQESRVGILGSSRSSRENILCHIPKGLAPSCRCPQSRYTLHTFGVFDVAVMPFPIELQHAEGLRRLSCAANFIA